MEVLLLLLRGFVGFFKESVFATACCHARMYNYCITTLHHVLATSIATTTKKATILQINAHFAYYLYSLVPGRRDSFFGELYCWNFYFITATLSRTMTAMVSAMVCTNKHSDTLHNHTQFHATELTCHFHHFGGEVSCTFILYHYLLLDREPTLSLYISIYFYQNTRLHC